MHHVALLVDGLLVEGNGVRPVLEDEHTRVNGRNTCRRHVFNVIHRLVGGGIGIQVPAILHTYRLQVFLQLIVLEVLSTIESHVLEQVSKTALVFILLHRPYFLCDVETRHMLRIVVMADVIGQSVVECSLTHVGVDWDVLCLNHHAEEQ